MKRTGSRLGWLLCTKSRQLHAQRRQSAELNDFDAGGTMAEKTTDRAFVVMLWLVMVATRTSAFAGNVAVPMRAASFVATFGVMPAFARVPQSQPMVVVMEEPAERAGG